MFCYAPHPEPFQSLSLGLFTFIEGRCFSRLPVSTSSSWPSFGRRNVKKWKPLDGWYVWSHGLGLIWRTMCILIPDVSETVHYKSWLTMWPGYRQRSVHVRSSSRINSPMFTIEADLSVGRSVWWAPSFLETLISEVPRHRKSNVLLIRRGWHQSGQMAIFCLFW